jgi:serine/threonine protein phosphatase PrpC/cell division protein FtsW (lipid II flippase)/cell division protein FtsI/penicillin-binding protein 2
MTGIIYNGKTDIGRQRADNQDAFLATDIVFQGKNAVLLSVIDGVGGYAGGDIAAGIAAEVVKGYLDGYSLQEPELGLEQAMISANNKIFREASESSEHCHMGCVASACVIDENFNLFFSHLGDTRIYIYQDGQLSKITHDHSPVGAMEDDGELSEQEAMSHPDRNIIFRMLGQELHRLSDGFIEHATVQLSGPCQILLCSDGLTDQLNSAEIKAILDERISLEAKTEKLIQASNEKGGKDNITVVVAEANAPEKKVAPVNLYEQQKELIENNNMMRSNRKLSGIIAMLFVSLGILLGFHALYKTQKPILDSVEQAYPEGRSISLDQDIPERALESMLYNGGYYPDARDARCVSHHIATSVARNQYSIKRLWDLRLWEYQIPSLTARYTGGSALSEMADSSFRKVGITPEIIAMYANDSIPAQTCGGTAEIEVRVVDAESHASVPGVLVRLKEHYYDDLVADSLRWTYTTVARDSVAAYAKTDSLGVARFCVEEGRSYSVLPIKLGFQYGKEKGTVGGVLKSKLTKYTFGQREHRISMFPGTTFSDIKSSMSLTVRTPDEYTKKMVLSLVLFLLSWWVAFIAVSRRDRKVRQTSERIIIPILMFISGVGVLAQFSMLNPLVDRLIGFDTVCTIAGAIGVFVLLQMVDVVRWYASDYRLFGKGYLPFDPLMSGSYKPLGLFYVFVAVLLMGLLAFIGTSPEGSDARISLFGWFQPADLCKFLVVIFLAAFFSSREEEIRAFSSITNRVSFGLQLRTIALVSLVILIVCGLYLTVLSDMGSGLICLLVFIFMYASARRDLWKMVLGIVTYVIVLLLATHYSSSVWTIIGVSLAWLVGWITVSFLTKKAIYESAIFFNLLVFILVAGGPILKAFPLTEHQGQKLMDRSAMTFNGVWNNEVEGAGDQVFLTIKSISSGGMLGQGLGKGHPNFTPAFTTDMVVAGISEQMGYVMVIALMLAYVLLAYFGLRAAVRSGHKFVYYLVYGISLATITQWIVIAGATLGVFCLSGIPAPFLAFGKSSALFHILAYALVIAASRYPYGYFSPVDSKTMVNRLSALPVCYIVAIALIAYGLRFACFERDATINRPGYFLDAEGEMYSEYDPRITDILETIDAGNIYDRNGLLLATSSREMLVDNTGQYVQCGIPAYVIEKESKRNLRRYYPFGEHLSFMLGNFNDKSLWSNSVFAPYGLGIENRYFSRLRGFDSIKKDMYGNNSHKRIVYNRRYRDRFLPAKSQRVEVVLLFYDYSPIVKLVKEGGDGQLTEKWNTERNSRDITLTLDARLQTIIQMRMAEAIAKDAVLSSKPKLRISVFIQEVNAGDMLASANYPLPQTDTILKLNAKRQYRYDESNPDTKAIILRDGGFTQTPCGSSAKPMTALAGMMTSGNTVCDKSYYVDGDEIIERGKANEPSGHYVSFGEAIKWSSNIYFIKYGLDNDVFDKLGLLYRTVGIRLDGHKGRGPMVPYIFDMEELSSELEDEYVTEVGYVRDKALPLYASYIKEHNATRLNAFRGSAEWWGWFYGQSTMAASPANMARVISIIAQNGKYIPTRYVLRFGEEDEPVRDAITVVPSGTKPLVDAMCSEAQKQKARGNELPETIDGIGSFFSKTGTPERGMYSQDKYGNLVYSEPNDGWYIFGVPCRTTSSHLAVALRMERLGSDGSSLAVKFASEVIIPAIKECGYQID